MRHYFYGYRFVPDQQEGLYNPQLCLHLLEKLWNDEIQASTILSEELNWTELVDPNVKLRENIFKFIAHNSLSVSIVVDLKTGPIRLQDTLEPTLRMEDLQKVASQSNIFLLSLMYYQGMVTFGEDGPALRSLRIPNRLAEYQFLDRLAVSLKPYVEKFLETLDPFDFQVLLRSVLAILGPMDDTFNESHIKESLLGQFSGHVNRTLVLKSEGEVSGGEQRTDLLLELKDGTRVVIELKVLMPHEFVLPVDENLLKEAETQTSKGTKFEHLPDNLRQACIFSTANHSKDITHFWDQTTKREVHRYLQNAFRNNAEKAELLGQDDLDNPSTTLEDLRLKKELDGAGTVSQYFEGAETQVKRFGFGYWNQESKGDVNFGKPRLFTITCIWNTHAVVKEVPFNTVSDSVIIVTSEASNGIKCRCQLPAVQKLAQKGLDKGKFYGCSRFPKGCGFYWLS